MTYGFELAHGDCIEVMRTMPDNSVDAIVTDPPYELGFMGKGWDKSGVANSVEMWREALRVLKPGGHLLAFSGSRTYHRMAVAIEDAGFEVRDQIMWLYGSGFPKSLDVSKAIDGKLTTGRSDSIALREVNETRPGEPTIRSQSQNGHAGFVGSGDVGPSVKRDTPATEAARQWQGWGTALKPAHEPIVVARKPLVGTVAENVLAHGTGAINVDGCRVEGQKAGGSGNLAAWREMEGRDDLPAAPAFDTTQGRWPANVIHDGSDEVLEAFPQAPGQMAKASTINTQRAGQNTYGVMARGSNGQEPRGDAGSAARFFYCAKASKADRGTENNHPTVKPTELMRYLCRLVTPPGGVVLDPFMGSGSTGKAAVLEGFRFIGIDMTAEYVAIARGRIGYVAGADLC